MESQITKEMRKHNIVIQKAQELAEEFQKKYTGYNQSKTKKDTKWVDILFKDYPDLDDEGKAPQEYYIAYQALWHFFYPNKFNLNQHKFMVKKAIDCHFSEIKFKGKGIYRKSY